MRKGETGFHQHYGELFGGRWETLYPALTERQKYAALETGLTKPYYLDPASLAVARLVPVADGREILDLCAAPGGKSLVMALELSDQGKLTANERSPNRRQRLMRVLEEHLPTELRERIRVTGHDARRWGLYEPATYDVVLADVPCSAERHQILQPSRLAQWNEQRIRRISTDQFAILAAAIDSAAPGGTIVYSTCALTPVENDAVIARALKRRASSVALVPLKPAHLVDRGAPAAEATQYGLQVLPDIAQGAGPMYVAMLRKQ